MSEKQWTNPLEWDSYHDESKFNIWESWCEWYEEWNKEVGALLQIVRTAKAMVEDIHADDVDDGHYFWSVGQTTWHEFTESLDKIPQAFKEVDNHGEATTQKS